MRPWERERGERFGALPRRARGSRSMAEVAAAAGSPRRPCARSKAAGPRPPPSSPGRLPDQTHRVRPGRRRGHRRLRRPYDARTRGARPRRAARLVAADLTGQDPARPRRRRDQPPEGSSGRPERTPAPPPTLVSPAGGLAVSPVSQAHPPERRRGRPHPRLRPVGWVYAAASTAPSAGNPLLPHALSVRPGLPFGPGAERSGLRGGPGNRHAAPAAQLGQQVLQVADLLDVVNDPGLRHPVGEPAGEQPVHRGQQW